jgi:hypothetical protein
MGMPVIAGCPEKNGTASVRHDFLAIMYVELCQE